jgi:uncharacterized protein (TIGR02246 family)
MRKPVTSVDNEKSAADRAEIRELLSEYCFNMDDGDFAGVASLFTEDGEWVAAYEQARGRDPITDLLERINPDRAAGPFRKHIVANSVVRVDGDAATSRASYLVLMAVDGRPAPIIVGTYDDIWTRTPQGWRIARRVLRHEIAGADLALRLPDPS